MSQRESDAERIFLQTLDKCAPGHWADFVERACGEDQELVRRVHRLLDAHGKPHAILDRGVINATADHPFSLPLGSCVGPYRLLDQIGSGGMGIVYLAQQDEPVERQVALKVIRPGLDTQEVLNRFHTEQQALAIMDHPNIAAVHDAGTTDAGRPFFVMERVDGVPITAYCDEHHVSTRDRLELFLAICHALQHAHQKGIIHRDIKPSNILVAQRDGYPIPKVIDFGVAKAIRGQSNTTTTATGDGRPIGTPLYMSPEQAAGSGTDVDTRSDIYSLGVLLYELLTGTTPVERKQLKDVAPDQLRHLICVQEPPRPSARISTLGRAAETVAERRHTNLPALHRSLDRELDWIVMKALEKDRDRRYQSATDFARDIERYLNDEPVEACPPSITYRISKFLRRNRTVTVATSAVLLALVAGTGIATWQAIRASEAQQETQRQLEAVKQQRHVAEQATEREAQQRKQAEAAQHQAEIARRQAEVMSTFLITIFRSPDPRRDGRTVTVAEMLDRAEKRVEDEFLDEPVLRAKMLGAIGETYLGLGLVAEALQRVKRSHDALDRQLSADDPDLLSSTEHLVDVYLAAGKWNDALPLAHTNVEARRRVLGHDHRATITSLRQLAQLYLALGQPMEALPLAKDALAKCQDSLGTSNRDTLLAMCTLAEVYDSLERYDEAVRLSEQAVGVAKKVLGPDRLETLTSMANLALAYSGARDSKKALQLEKGLLPRFEEMLGPDHPVTLQSRNNLAEYYLEVGQKEEAARLHEETLKLIEAKLGTEHPVTLDSMENLGRSYGDIGRWHRAISLQERAHELRERLFPQHPDTHWSLLELMHSHDQSGNEEKADSLSPLAIGSLLKLAEFKGPMQINILDGLHWGALVWLEEGKLDDAASLLEKVVRIKRDAQGNDHPDTLGAVMLLGHIQVQRSEYTAAESLLLEAYEGYAERCQDGGTAADKISRRCAAKNLVHLYQKSKASEKAASWKEKLDVLNENAQPIDVGLVPEYVPRCFSDNDTKD